MDEHTLLRYHALYQKSVVPRDPKTPRDMASQDISALWRPKKSGPPSKTTTTTTTTTDQSWSPAQSLSPARNESPRRNPSPRRNSPSPRRNPSPSTPHLSQQGGGIKPKQVESPSSSRRTRVVMDPLTARRSQRSTRSRPWLETPPSLSSRSDDVEFVYEAFLPKEEWAEFKARKYVTNSRYGQLYEVKRDKPRPSPREPPDSHWLWENEFRVWRMEKASPWASPDLHTDGPVSEVSRNELVTMAHAPDTQRPHADLFAAYHNRKLLNQRRDLAATVIQRRVRGWIVRKRMKDMKRQALLGLGRAWPRITNDHRELLTRIQIRKGVPRVSCPFSLDGMQDYLDRREKYERVFEKVSTGNKLPRDQLTPFLQECGHFPTEGEITAAFNTVFRGSGTRAEVVFVLDCSYSVGNMHFADLKTFVKDIVRMLPVGPDSVRVGVVPYNTDVFQSFGLLRHSSMKQILDAIDDIRYRPGVTHTDVALRIMMDIFQDSRPGVQKVAVVVTDGQSAHGERTALEAKRAAASNVTVFAVGVGNNVHKEELESIARDASRVMMCSSYRTLTEVKRIVNNALCLRACTLCQYILPRIHLQGLYKGEVVEIVFTLFHPKALPLHSSAPATDCLAHLHRLNISAQTLMVQRSSPEEQHDKADRPSKSVGLVSAEKELDPEKISGVSTVEASTNTSSDIENADPEMTSEGYSSGGKAVAGEGWRESSSACSAEEDEDDGHRTGPRAGPSLDCNEMQQATQGPRTEGPTSDSASPDSRALTESRSPISASSSAADVSQVVKTDSKETVNQSASASDVKGSGKTGSSFKSSSQVNISNSLPSDCLNGLSGQGSCMRGSVQDLCRPLTRSEALEVIWTLYPLPASGVEEPRSRWIRPLVDGEPAWALLDEDVISATDFKVCLGLVVKSRLQREGFISIPSDLRAGVEEVTTYEEAMRKIEDYLAQKKNKQKKTWA